MTVTNATDREVDRPFGGAVIRGPGGPTPRNRLGLDASLPRDLRRNLALLALTPLLFLLVPELPWLLEDPLLASYGALALLVTIVLFYIAYVHYVDPATEQLPGRPSDLASFPAVARRPRVSMLLAVRNEAKAIADCVRSILDSDCPHMELVVVDDASTDTTPAILDALSAKYGFTVVHLAHNVGKKRALVHAAALARGDIIAFTDSDCVLARDALSRCVRAMVLHPELGAVSGHARAWNAGATVLTRMQDAWYEGQFRVAKAAEAVFGSVTCVSGPLAVFRREAIYNYMPAWDNDRFLGGEFRLATDRQLTAYVLGQPWIGDRLKQRHRSSPFVKDVDYPARAWRIGYVRSARVWTLVPTRLPAFLRQQVRWKKSFIRNIFFTGRFIWRRGPGPALMYYGHVLWVILAPFMAVRHLVWAPWHGLWVLSLLYLAGILIKGTAWAVPMRIEDPTTSAWRYRPLMSVLSAVLLSWLLPYAIVTIRRQTWSRGTR